MERLVAHPKMTADLTRSRDDDRPDLPTRTFALARRAWQHRWPMVAISHHAKVGYLPVPKAGNTAILTVLTDLEHRAGNMERFHDPRTGEPHPLQWLRPVGRSAWSRLWAYHRGYTWFSVVRNPWHRLVSCYLDKICGSLRDHTEASGQMYDGLERYNRVLRHQVFWPGMPFDAFVRRVARIPDFAADPHFRSQYKRFTTPWGDILADMLIPLEQPDGLRVLLSRHIGDAELPQVRVTSSINWRSFYTPELAAIVGRRYRHDVALLQYKAPC